MSPPLLLSIALAALATAALAATAEKVLRHFARHELESYCRRRGRPERFSEILAGDERAAVGAEILRIIAVVTFVFAGGLWYLSLAGQRGALGGMLFAAAIGAAAMALLGLTAWIPWAVVRVWSAPFLFHTWRLWQIVALLMWPFAVGVSVSVEFLRRLADRPEQEEDEEEAFEDEVRAIVTEGMHEGLMKADAGEMIERVIELHDRDVSDIMTPRSDLDAMDVSLPSGDALRLVIESGRTRLPVYEERVDNIVGVLYAKDLLGELAGPPDAPRRALREILRPHWTVPKTMRLDDLLRRFLRTRNHLAIVADEYNALAGIVTIEDVLEEIVGEIEDEWDEDEIDEIRPSSDGAAECLGRAHIDDVNERLGLELPESDDYDTLAGLVISTLGCIPVRGESLHADGARITVLEADRRKIARLRVEMREHE